MICPFRLNVEFEYIPIPCKKDEEPSFLEKTQKQVYPPCMKDECPFYNTYGLCSRVLDE